MDKPCVYVDLNGEKCQHVGHQVNDSGILNGSYIEFCKDHYNVIQCYAYSTNNHPLTKCMYVTRSTNCTNDYIQVMLGSKPIEFWVYHCTECYNKGPRNNPSIDTVKKFVELLREVYNKPKVAKVRKLRRSQMSQRLQKLQRSQESKQLQRSQRSQMSQQLRKLRLTKADKD